MKPITVIHPSTSTRDVAVRALRDRGVDNADEIVKHAEYNSVSYEMIVGACEWFDTQRGNISPGLLVWKVKQGGVQPRNRNESTTGRRPRIEYDQSHLPLFYLSHRQWELDHKFEADCAGRLMIVGAEYPVLKLECDACGFEAGMPHRGIPGRLRGPLGLQGQDLPNEGDRI
jgi:hypothetical protein